MMEPILIEGQNCWSLARANRAAFIIDGEDYFRALREAMCRARRSIFIVGWDVHSKLKLVRNGTDDDLPETLAALIDELARRRKDLNIYILLWDFAMIYTMEREFFPYYRLSWRSHKRVQFCLDDEHPVGGSQHQKIVVIDECVAFSGGFDLSKWRWDTSEHRVNDARRTEPGGAAYPTFHDVQMIVDGAAAAALGELARDRWSWACSIKPVRVNSDPDHDPWPESITPVLHDVNIGIARTLPAFKGRDEVREVEHLYLDSIQAARHFIYIENQHFTSYRIGQALSARLKEADGPEIIIVMPEKTDGWLEQHTMDVLRARLLRELRQPDSHDRLRIFYVRLQKNPHVSLMVHAKVMIVDDRFARVASSNLTSRSMGLDSECDLAVESSETMDCRRQITDFRRRLLAEHLNCDAEAMAHAEKTHGSLIKAIDALRGNERSLEPLEADIPVSVDRWVPPSLLLDPEKPVEPDEMFDYFVSPDQQRPILRHQFKAALLIFGVVVLAALWRWTPLGEWIDLDAAAAVGQWIDDRPFTPLMVMLIYLFAGSAGVPITLMIIATVMVFGAWPGMFYALAGAEISAMTTFFIGHLLGRDAVKRFAGSRVNRLSKTLAKRGIVTIIVVRIIPMAPFSVVNIIAGVSDIRFRDYAIGTLIGLLPGVIAIGLLADRLVASLREPTMTQIIILIAVGAVILSGLYALRLRLSRRKSGQ
jgi:phospholipase D1/2